VQDEYTLMHWAAFNNRPSLIPPMVGLGADVNAKTVYDNTPLHMACYRPSCKPSALVLLGLGADITIEDNGVR